MPMIHSFKLAPMSPLILGLTVALWLLVAIAGGVALITRQPGAIAVVVLLLAIYGVVWFGCRPARFVITDSHLDIVFPAWRRSIPRADVVGVRMLAAEQFQAEFGWAIRIGAGGLWGGFGWLQTARQGLLEFYVSTTGQFLLIERAAGRSLLITPDRPEEMQRILMSPRSQTQSGSENPDSLADQP